MKKISFMEVIFLKLPPSCKQILQNRVFRIVILSVAVIAALLILVPQFTRVLPTETYLVIGTDNYGSLDDVGRSDAMMLVTLNHRAHKVIVTSLARDMFVTYNRSQIKINTVIRGHGEQGLMDVITDTFGVPINGYFRVNFSSLVSIVDLMGGVDVDLTAEEVNYINRNAGTYPGYKLREGVSHMNGAQALSFARCRKLDNDVQRGARQTRLASALVAKAKRMNPVQLISLMRDNDYAWRSSLSPVEQLFLAIRALPLRRHSVRVSIPFEGAWRYGNSKSGDGGILIDEEENRRLLLEAIN